MSGIFNTQASIAEELEPGIREFVGEGFKSRPELYTSLVRVSDSDKAAEHILEVNDLGLPSEKDEGQPIATDSVIEGPKKNISHRVFALAAGMSWEALRDEKYGRLKRASTALGRSMVELLNIKGHILYNDGFSAETAIDNVAVFSASHINRKLGTTWSNLGSTDLTYTGVQDVYTNFMNMTDGTGKKAMMMPDTLAIPPEYWVTAKELFGGDKQPYVADNTVNVLSGDKKLTTFITPYLNDTDSWFVRAPLTDINAHFFFRERPMQDSWDDRSARVSYFATIVRIGWGVSDPHGLWGSPGA
jgi:hypothetical protein